MMIISPRESASLISQLAKHVSISAEGVKNASKFIMKCIQEQDHIQQWKSHKLHPKIKDESFLINWIFFVDTLNFSFWSEADKQYKITYNGETYSGYWSLCAAVNRALDEGINIISATYYSKVSLETLNYIFRSDTDVKMPLLDTRHIILNETGKILLEKFNGSFENCITLCKNSATKLLEIIIENFPSYKDEAKIKCHKVSFYKRAQILIGDLWACFEGKGYGAFDDIDEITMFADYRVPQVLIYLGVLKYSDELEHKLRIGELLQNGEQYEVEIRGCTIWAVEMICQHIKKMSTAHICMKDKEYHINSILIDYLLWDYRRAHAKELEHIPYHRTRCIYY